jgi:ABC-type sugar transport system permease subunit
MPTLILLSTFNLFPVLYTAYISLQHDNLLSPPAFVGLANFREIVADPQFWESLRVTGEYVLVVGPISWVIAFSLALILKSGTILRRLFMALLFLPSLMPIVAMSVVWENLLQPNGPVNRLLGINVPWLSDPNTVIFGISLLGIWYSVGWFMVVFFAGLSTIPGELYEASALDGAKGPATLRWLTLPLMRPIFAYVVVQTTINGLQVFTPMYLMTGGGPNNASTSISLYIYQQGLTDLNMGGAAAASVVGLGCVLVLCAIYLHMLSAERAEARARVALK